MNFLELKIPPVALVFVTGGLMWLVSWSLPVGTVVAPGRVFVAITLAFAGVIVSALGVMAFRKASTTVNPTKPESTSSLVCSGMYTVSRNPMYLGFLLILLGWAFFLANLLALLALPAFLLYMNRFQIEPEERTLSLRFERDFATYTAQVRRWL